MPQFKRGDLRTMLHDLDSLLLFSANGMVNLRGALVMGAGFAKEVRDEFAAIDYEIGQRIIGHYGVIPGCPYRYGLVIQKYYTGKRIGAFQVKLHFERKAMYSLISWSASRLARWCRQNPSIPVHMNFPGIGLGGLSRSQVLPVLERLPEQVTVWELENGGKR